MASKSQQNFSFEKLIPFLPDSFRYESPQAYMADLRLPVFKVLVFDLRRRTYLYSI